MTRLLLVAAALATLVLAGVAAAAMPPVPYFSQCDSRWGSDKLGGDGPTICSQGCALTSAAMVMAYYGVDTDPERLNNAIGRLGYADQSVAFGEPDDLPVIRDWDGDGDDDIGLYCPGSTTGVFYLDIDNDGRAADIVTPEYGDLGDIPIAGDWDGDSDDNIGVYRPETGEFFMDATVPDVLPSKTIYVDDDFDDEPSEHKWDTIQEGVDDASDGDTVIVYAGEYVENVDVNKSITLQGEGADVVTVRAADAEDHVFNVTASWVNISEFTATGATTTHYYNAGIYLNGVDHCNIFENIASNNEIGIYLYDAKNTTLTNNTANSNDRGSGICIVHDSSNNTLTNNNASDNEQGIYLWDSKNNTLTNNTANSNNWYGIGMWDSKNNILESNTANSNNECGIHLGSSSNSTLTNNTANSNNCDGILMSYSSNSTLTNNTANSNNGSGINLQFSSNNTLTSNTANSNYVYGIRLWNSKNNTLTSNTANSNNYDGINLYYSSDNNMLQNNNVSYNDHGIWLFYSSDNTLQSNTANSNSDHGIWLYESNNNTLYHNNLIDNTDCNAYDTGTNNTWDSGSEGNYYSDYTGTDPDGDGIGNDPHPIPGGGSVDRFPLMQPWTGGTPKIGDMNGDDQITPADTAIALQIAVGGSTSCDQTTLAAADVSGDNRVTSLDALMILQAAGTPDKVITWYSYEEGMEIAGAQNKTVMIEVYTVWCKWCKEMDLVIYTDPDVIDLADQFVCIKIDADKHRDLATRYNPAGGVPTTVFIRSDDTEVHRVVGYPRGGAEAFIQEMMVALSNA